MRRLLAAMVLTVPGCASGRISVATNPGGARFDFHRGKAPLVVSGIEVFEFDAGRRGQTVCELRPDQDSYEDRAAMDSWAYGAYQGGYTVPACRTLSPGRPYEILVYHSHHCVMSLGFSVAADRSVRELGAGLDSCPM